MPDIFDKPWTLLGAAVLVLFGMLTFRSIFPEKRRWWQLSVPLLLAFAAFGVDMLVQTDLEKIHSVINAALNAVQQQDYRAIEFTIADKYEVFVFNILDSFLDDISGCLYIFSTSSNCFNFL